MSADVWLGPPAGLGVLAAVDPLAWWRGLVPLNQSGVLIAAGVLIYFFVRLVLLRGMDRLAASTDNDLDDRLVHFVRRFFGLALVFALVMGVLHVHEVEISPLLAGAGIVGIAVGFAAKETLADVLAGIFLIADRPMRVGDRVKIEYIGRDWGGWGDVVDIGLRRTRVRNTDGVVVNYPNNVLANSVITNFSEQKTVRVRVRFAVDAAADLERAHAVALDAINRVEGVLPETASVVVRSLWDETRGHLLAGVLMEGRYSIADVRHRTRIRSRVLMSLQNGLRGANLAPPRPRLTVEQEPSP